MLIIRSLRTGASLMVLSAIMLVVTLSLSGCSETETSPPITNAGDAPVLPATDQLKFDFSFFDSGAKLEKAAGDYDNFVNAYLRAVVLEAMAQLVLAAPVGTFTGALNTVPVAQPDGSWVWTYDWQYGPDPIVVSLRGMPAGDVVEWELSLSPKGGDYSVLWFSGTTNGDGSTGHWIFHDLDTDGYPVSGEIAWGSTDAGNYLEFVCREPDGNGDTLRFNDNDPDFSIEFTPGDGADLSFIRWHASGTGSLQVPDYNAGLEACWDIYQWDTDCQ